MAVSHRKACERARAKWDAASSAFLTWAIANGFGMVRANELDAALAGNATGEKLLAADRAARKALDEAESAAVSAGHAWRGTFSMVHFYSPSEIRRFSRNRFK